MTRKTKASGAPQRVRLEFTAIPQPGGEYRFLLSTRLGILQRLIRDRFGNEGEATVTRWLQWITEEVQTKRIQRQARGMR